MNALDLIDRATARRAEAGLVANNGIACPNALWVDYYNFRDAVLSGDIARTPANEAKVRAMKAAAVASTSGCV
jgi:uncharacterized small protein (DUF1192 family)